jgi:DNA-binding transcriptional ArsR family regulator
MGSVEPVDDRLVSQAEHPTAHHLARRPRPGVGGPGVPVRRRPATDTERKALASSLRLRILRLTLDEALTNQELAVRLERDPATVLHHVRVLVDAGFLVAEEQRRGPRGSRERPYRATRLSWELDGGADPEGAEAMAEAFLAELRAASWRTGGLARLGLRLTDGERAELEGRLQEVLDEFAARTPGEGAQPWSVFLAVHPDAGRS